jgi:hypothetical protein
MKRFRSVALVFVIAAVAVALAGAGQPIWIAVAVAVIGLGMWASTGCFHPRPLSLLPPTRTADGSVKPAQWFCSSCGRSWPAMIDHPHPPVPRFVGHDEAKAAAAAKRAAALEVRTRELAVARSGIKSATAPAKRTGPVAVQARRAG